MNVNERCSNKHAGDGVKGFHLRARFPLCSSCRATNCSAMLPELLINASIFQFLGNVRLRNISTVSSDVKMKRCDLTIV